MCRNAAWTEPADQSVWFYQRWLFGHLPKLLQNDNGSLQKLITETLARDQIKSINELIEEEGRGFNVALAMSFVRFMTDKEDKKDGNDYLKDLELGIGHHSE